MRARFFHLTFKEVMNIEVEITVGGDKGFVVDLKLLLCLMSPFSTGWVLAAVHRPRLLTLFARLRVYFDSCRWQYYWPEAPPLHENPALIVLIAPNSHPDCTPPLNQLS